MNILHFSVVDLDEFEAGFYIKKKKITNFNFKKY